MGYYTRYKLEITPYMGDEDKLIEELAKASGYGNLFDEERKWYDHEDDMKNFSEKHPDRLFKLLGEGEGDSEPDLWHKYFKNGKMQVCKSIVSYPSFDESQLK